MRTRRSEAGDDTVTRAGPHPSHAPCGERAPAARRESTLHDHFHSLQRMAGNAAVGQLVAQRVMFNKGVAVAALTAGQAATEISYGELPGVSFAFAQSYVSYSDTKTKTGKARTANGFGEEFTPSIGSWVLHTHRGAGGGLTKVHTKPTSYSDKHFDVTISKAKDKGYLKDPDGTNKPK